MDTAECFRVLELPVGASATDILRAYETAKSAARADVPRRRQLKQAYVYALASLTPEAIETAAEETSPEVPPPAPPEPSPEPAIYAKIMRQAQRLGD